MDGGDPFKGANVNSMRCQLEDGREALAGVTVAAIHMCANVNSMRCQLEDGRVALARGECGGVTVAGPAACGYRGFVCSLGLYKEVL